MNGSKIRQLRLSKNLTLKDLASLTQTTAGYISQLERDLIDPSLSTLRKIAAVLDTPLFSLLDSQDDVTMVVRHNRRQKMSFADSNVILEVLTPQSNQKSSDLIMMTFEINAKSWSNDERVSHNVDECFYAQKGKLEVLVGDTTYILEEGDSIYIKANTPHNIYNPNDSKAIGVSTMSSAYFISVVRP